MAVGLQNAHTSPARGAGAATTRTWLPDTIAPPMEDPCTSSHKGVDAAARRSAEAVGPGFIVDIVDVVFL